MDLKSGFKVGAWDVHPLTGELQRGDESTRLEPKVMEVLMALAERSGSVVAREELLRTVWGNRAAVSDEPLTRCIAELRRAFGDSRQTPTYIQTIPKRGYRLLLPVAARGDSSARVAPPAVEVAPSAPAPVPTARSEPEAPIGLPPPPGSGARRGHRPLWLGGLVVAAIALTTFGWQQLRGTSSTITPTTARNTLAVLPFADMSDNADGAYFGEGLAEEVLGRLNSVTGLRVVARTSSFSAAERGGDIRTIAERLQVAHVLEGTVRRDGDRVRIGARLIDAQRGFQIWSASYDGVLDDIFALQDDIANTIVNKLRDTVPTVAAEREISTAAPTDNLAAYELFLRGRQFLHRRDEEPLRRSIQLFRDAIALDPDFGQAYVELAKAYALLPSYSAEIQEEMFDDALATLAEGSARDPSIDDSAQVVVALVNFARWRWIDAEIAFARALRETPNDSDLFVWYSQFLAAVGRTNASLEYARRAKDIDVLSPVANHRVAVASMWSDDDAEAVRQTAIATELGMGPIAAPDSYIVFKLRQRDYAAVRPLLIGVQTMFAQPTAWVDPLLAALESPAQRPRAVEALARAEEARDIPRKYLFGAWVYLAESDRALATGLKLVNDRPSFNVEFLFAREASALRAHPRFGDLVRAIGLHRYWDEFGWPTMCAKNEDDILCH